MSGNVAKCVHILSTAKNDNEKLAGLFLTTKVAREEEFDAASRKALFEAVGFDFFAKLLAAEDVPDAEAYKSLALTILASFCLDPQIATHRDLLNHFPIILNILKAAVEASNVEVADRAFEVLKTVAIHNKTLSEGAVIIAQLCIDYDYREIEMLKLFIMLLFRDPLEFSNRHADVINALLNKVACAFKEDQTRRKFELMILLRHLILVPDESQAWFRDTFSGLRDILKTKLHKTQRDPALMLAATAVDALGVKWLIQSDEEPMKYFFLIVHLCAIEVRLQMEEITFKEVMKEARLISSCFAVLEASIYYMASDEVEIDPNDLLKVYPALKNAFTSVLSVLKEVSSLNYSTNTDESFVIAMVKVLTAWLTQDTTFAQPEIFETLPFILKVANETFYSKKSDVLRLLLPVLTQMVIDDTGRQVVLETNQLKTLVDCAVHHYNNEQTKETKHAIIHICDIFSNVSLLEPPSKLDNDAFDAFINFVISKGERNLQNDGCLTITALVILKQLQHKLIRNIEMQQLILNAFNFLYAAHHVDRQLGTISETEYHEIMDFWFLGFDTLSSLISTVPWLPELADDNAWTEKITEVFTIVRPSAFPPNLKPTFESILCSLAVADDRNKSIIKNMNGLKMCKIHKLTDLISKINN